MATRPLLSVLVVSAASLAVSVAEAQPLGTFRWQMQPYCNVVTLAITQHGGVYRLEGTDDQCGRGRDQASVQGLAFMNPDGGIGFGLTLVTTPGGAPLHVDAEIALASLGGTWRDSAGATGTFAFSPGASSGGSPRPQPSASVPASIRLLIDGGLVAGGVANAGTIPASGAGPRMMWYPGKASFRAGHVDGVEWNDANIGAFSVAMGRSAMASGVRSTAFGAFTGATGDSSTAMGLGASANGYGSTAMGVGTRASGDSSTAMGSGTVASGRASLAAGELTLAGGISATALGFGTQAVGSYATAIGRFTIAGGEWSFAGGSSSRSPGAYAFAFGLDAEAAGAASFALGRTARTTSAAAGSLMFADASSSAPFVSNAPNEVGVRAAGGVYLYTRADLATGVALSANGSSWAALSDANAKENFRDVDGEDLLARLAAVPVREWNYKAQDTTIRHFGPTAQDFRAAFGLGDFPLRINTIDADGVALAGVKALDARTRMLNAHLTREIDDLRARLARLEALLDQR